MALAYQRQIRQIYLLKTKKASLKELVDAGDFFPEVTPIGTVMHIKEVTGNIVSTKIIDPKRINYTTLTHPVKKVGPEVTYSFEKDPTKLVGESVTFVLKVHYGESEDIYMHIVAGREIQEGDTKAIIMTDIAQQLAFALGNDQRTNAGSQNMVDVGGKQFQPNIFFEISVSGDTFTIKEKNWLESKYSLHLKLNDIMWRLTGRLFNELMNSTTIKATVVNEAKVAKPIGQGYQMLAYEDFLLRQRAELDTFSQGYDKHREHAFKKSVEYTVLDVSFYDLSRDNPHHSDQMLLFAEEGKDGTALKELYTVLVDDTNVKNHTVVNAPTAGGAGRMSAPVVEGEKQAAPASAPIPPQNTQVPNTPATPAQGQVAPQQGTQSANTGTATNTGTGQ